MNSKKKGKHRCCLSYRDIRPGCNFLGTTDRSCLLRLLLPLPWTPCPHQPGYDRVLIDNNLLLLSDFSDFSGEDDDVTTFCSATHHTHHGRVRWTGCCAAVRVLQNLSSMRLAAFSRSASNFFSSSWLSPISSALCWWWWSSPLFDQRFIFVPFFSHRSSL